MLQVTPGGALHPVQTQRYTFLTGPGKIILGMASKVCLDSEPGVKPEGTSN